MHELERPLVQIVEDDQAVATLIADVLHDRGYRTLVATTAHTALQQLDCLQPDVLTLDLSLPGISGITLLKLLRAQWSADVLPIIVVTAHPRLDPLVRAHAQAVVLKPFDPDELAITIHKLLADRAGLTARVVGE